MDTLMDNLAQKLDAQEMIRANGEAELAQMNFLKTQVSEYMGCLDRMQQVCTDLGNIESQISAFALPDNSANEEAIKELKSQVSELAKETNEKLSQISEATGDQFKKFQTELLDKVSTDDNLHKENVRLYKNIQAAIAEEIDPVMETLSDAKKQIRKDIAGIKALAIVSVVLSAASIGVMILSILNII